MNIAARNTASSHLRDLSRIGTTAIILSFVFSFLATVFVGLRFWVRRIKRVGPLLEDWLVLVALVRCSELAYLPLHSQGDC